MAIRIIFQVQNPVPSAESGEESLRRAEWPDDSRPVPVTRYRASGVDGINDFLRRFRPATHAAGPDPLT